MTKGKGGRKSKYHTHVEPRLKEIEAWARDGLTDEQIAKNLGVAYSTFRKYKDEYPAFSAALKKGKEVVDIEVENRSEEHTSELQSRENLVCRLLLEKKKLK